MPRIETIDYPQDWPEADDSLMSNFDGEVDERVEKSVRQGYVAGYPGWNFNAKCWFENGKFLAAVRCHRALVATFEADTPKELMNEVSQEYGFE